jgi:hypothetical protein
VSDEGKWVREVQALNFFAWHRVYLYYIGTIVRSRLVWI